MISITTESVYIAVKDGIETMNADEVVHRNESLRKQCSDAGKIGGKITAALKGYDKEGKSIHSSEIGRKGGLAGGKAVMKSKGYNEDGKLICSLHSSCFCMGFIFSLITQHHIINHGTLQETNAPLLINLHIFPIIISLSYYYLSSLPVTV